MTRRCVVLLESSNVRNAYTFTHVIAKITVLLQQWLPTENGKNYTHLNILEANGTPAADGARKRVHVEILQHHGVLSHTFASPFLHRLSPSDGSPPTGASILDSQHDDLTLVTMYLDIGKIQKGRVVVYTPNRYKNWMRVFGCIQNPVVAFFDNSSHAEFFLNIRENYRNTTRIILLENRSDLWAFRIMPKIQEIFESPGYPHNPPGTTVPEYSCAMHAKYEVMLWAVQQNIFNTRYFAWLDIGLFRDLKSSEPFHMYPPPDFDPKRVAYTEVNNRQTLTTLDTVLHRRRPWICGAFFLGNPTVLRQWSWQYHATIESMLRENIMVTDQEVHTLCNGNVNIPT